jgi:biopolymer transport protein ExbB
MIFSARRAPRSAFAIGVLLMACIPLAGLSTNSLLSASQPVVGSNTVLTLAMINPVVTRQDNGAEAIPPPAPEKKGINFLSLLTQGGWFMFPLLLLSIGVVTIAIERYLTLRRERVFPSELIEQLSLLSHSPGGMDPMRAYQLCQRFPSSASYVIRSMLVKVGRPQSEMENAVSEASQREATRLTQMTSWLSLAAAIAPLIGLLGTVWGITQAFYDTTQLAELNAGQNRGVALANGIYVALVTTMAGLMIAIPAAVISHFYENRIIQLMNEIEEMVYNLLPQFERYEGQVRFTQGVGDDDSVEADAGVGSQFATENGSATSNLAKTGVEAELQ